MLFSSGLLLFSSGLLAAEIRVATASNFTVTMKLIARQFEADTGHKITIISGSTGKHYAQIKNGAPFDVFFAADTKRAELLDIEGVAIPGSRFTYAIGKVVLWSATADYVDAEGKVLSKKDFRHLAIANPKLAPYGKAAQEIMQELSVWEALQTRMVRGENIGQTFQFIKSSNAELGFVSFSQVKRPGQPVEGSLWAVPQALYTPIEQQAVLLKDSAAAHAFLSFVKSPESLHIIRSFGYGIPGAE
ncbi:MAG: molybdate ABC transporter substrate-binding protein, partial [Gammaproteobacteria bacterium]|nr:molybdate ABC transporter substrate-binding protein [Gammaproteobacteria bacterium]